jgi:hypothetical protein
MDTQAGGKCPSADFDLEEINPRHFLILPVSGHGRLPLYFVLHCADMDFGRGFLT